MRAIATFFGKVAYAFVVVEPYVILLLVRPFANMPEGFLMRMVECLAILCGTCLVAYWIAKKPSQRQEAAKKELKRVQLAHPPAYIACLLLGIWWWQRGTTEVRLRALILWGTILAGFISTIILYQKSKEVTP